jgi:hypothetical protein
MVGGKGYSDQEKFIERFTGKCLRRSALSKPLTRRGVRLAHAHLKSQQEGGNAILKIGSALLILFALVAIGFGVYEFVHREVSNGSLSFLLGMVILNFAFSWMGVFGD